MSGNSTEAAVANVETAAAVLEHIRAHIGPVDTVFHEIESNTIAIDIHHVPPTPARNCHTLITSGMSDQPMPEGAGVRFAELVMSLPPDWPMDEEALEEDAGAWPLEMLRALGRLPFAHGLPSISGFASTVRPCPSAWPGMRDFPPFFWPRR
jgi:hypothetical protein